MAGLWWLVGTVLIVLSIVLMVAGLQGREGVLRIGKPAPAEENEPPEEQPRSVRISNVGLGVVGIVVGLAAVLVFAI